MKKFTIALIIMAGFGLTAFGQSLNDIDFSFGNTASRSGIVAQGNNNPVSLKGGVINAIAVSYSDDFSLPNDTDGLKARGYLPYFRGTGPMGTFPAWFQGDAANWGDFNNGSSEYVCSNYQSVTGTNDIDNWLVLPALDVATGDQISFYSRSPLNSTYPDSIRVMYSAAGDSTPEGTSWVELGRFQVNTTGAWLQEVFTAATAGTTARFAIRYTIAASGPTGLNGDLIGIDQLDVFTPAAVDISANSVVALSAEYTQIPSAQLPPLTLTGTVKNNGASATTGGTALFEVINTTTSGVAFSETVNLPGIAIGATAAVSTTNQFTAAVQDFFKVRITTNIAGDGISSNDTIESVITQITDTVYARDNDINVGSLGIGVGPASDGLMGQNFVITNQAYLTSVSFFITSDMNPNPSGSPVWVTIHAQTPGSEPTTVPLATTDSLLLMPGAITAPGQWFTLPLSGSPLVLSPGLYYAGVHEFDSLLTLGTASSIATANAVWVSWNTIPAPPAVNGWATASAFGFSVAYQVRLNIDLLSGISSAENSNGFSVYPNPSSGIIYLSSENKVETDYSIKVYNAIGQEVFGSEVIDFTNTIIDLSAQPAGIYHIQVTNGSVSFHKAITISNN